MTMKTKNDKIKIYFNPDWTIAINKRNKEIDTFKFIACATDNLYHGSHSKTWKLDS